MTSEEVSREPRLTIERGRPALLPARILFGELKLVARVETVRCQWLFQNNAARKCRPQRGKEFVGLDKQRPGQWNHADKNRSGKGRNSTNWRASCRLLKRQE